MKPVVELKTVKAIAPEPEHEAQIPGYLKSSRLGQGVLKGYEALQSKRRKKVLRRKSRHRNFKALPDNFASLRLCVSLPLTEGIRLAQRRKERQSNPFPKNRAGVGKNPDRRFFRSYPFPISHLKKLSEHPPPGQNRGHSFT